MPTTAVTAIAQIKEVKARHTKALLKLANVKAVGIGYKNNTKEPCIVVTVTSKAPIGALATEDLIPSEIEGVKTDVIGGGTPVARAVEDHAKRYRPIRPGTSIGHKDITAGTFGCVVYVGSERTPFILSNNHVLANSNAAQIGDSILQPGPYDGGTSGDVVGSLAAFKPIVFSGGSPIPPIPPGLPDCGLARAIQNVGNFFAGLLGSRYRISVIDQTVMAKSQAEEVNTMDAALASISVDIDPTLFGLDLPITGVGDPELGDEIVKSGRTTGVTRDTIRQIDVTVQVQYGAGQVAIFENQLLAGPMSAGGDSGSVIVRQTDGRAIGLLFAGSDEVTIFSPIRPILDHFKVTL